MSLETQITKSRTIKNSSLNTYLSSLKTLKKKIEPTENTTLTDTKFLHDYDKVINSIKDDKLTSKKNKLTSILVALNSDDPKNTELIDKYQKELKDLSDKYMVFLKQQKKTETQSKNWLSYDDLIKVINNVMSEVKLRQIMKKEELTNKEFDILQELLILRTYIAFPLRNDFADMKILSLKEYKKIDDTVKNNNNYMVLSPNNKKSFYINQFKNEKFLGAKILEIPQKLNRVINLWLKFNKSGFYLVKTDRKTPMNPNGITKFLNKIFIKYCKKKISTSMIRHIVISNMLKDEPTIQEKDEEKKEIENTFLHTKEMNDLYRKVDREGGEDIDE